MRGGRTVSVVIPCRDEEEGIPVVLGSVPAWVDEVIVVDNASTDRTAEQARVFGVRVVREETPGYGRACKTGIRAATGVAIALVDGDATYPIDELARIVDPILEDAQDFVSFARKPTRIGWDADRMTRAVGNTVLSWAVRVLFGIRLRDSQSGMWALSRRVREELARGSDGMGFSEEIKIRAFRLKPGRAREVACDVEPARRLGRSKLRLWGDGFANLLHLVTLRARGTR